MHTYIHTYIRKYVYTHINVHAYIHTYIHKYVYTHINAHTYILAKKDNETDEKEKRHVYALPTSCQHDELVHSADRESCIAGSAASYHRNKIS